MKVESRYAIMTDGGQCVMTYGDKRMHKWCADSKGFQLKV